MVESSETKVRCDLSLIFHKCRITVAEKKDLHIKFERAGKAVETKKIQVDPSQTEFRFEKAGKCDFKKQSFFQLSDGSFKTDIATYTLICGGEVVGVVKNDLAPHIGQKRKAFRAGIAASGASSTDGTVLLGDPEKFPNVALEVHVKIEPSQSAGGGAPTVSDTSSVFEPASTRSRDSGKSSKLMPADLQTPDSDQVAAATNPKEEKDDLDEDMLEEIRLKSEAAIAILREEKQPELDKLDREIERLRATRDQLESCKTDIDNTLLSDVTQEEDFDAQKKQEIAQLHERIANEKRQREELEEKVLAFHEVKKLIEQQKQNLTEEQKREATLKQLKERRVHLEEALVNMQQ